MEQKYNEKMSQLGYNNLVCDILSIGKMLKTRFFFQKGKRIC